MDSVNKYKSYDFFVDENWNSYISNIFPPPTRSQLEKIKRKWYHQNIDPSFDVKFDAETSKDESMPDEHKQEEKLDDNKAVPEPEIKKEEKKPKEEPKPQETQKPQEKPKDSEPKPHQHHPNCSHSHSETSTPSNAVSTITNILFSLEGFLKFNFLISMIILPDYASFIALGICVLALIRQCKRPRWNKEYAEKLIYNEYFHNIWYMVPFFFFPKQQSFIYFIPLGIHSWIGLCEFINLKKGKLYELLKNPVDKTRNKRAYLMSMKQKVEIFQLFNLVVLLFLAQSNLLIILLYSNYIRIKYVVNKNLMLAFYEINLWIKTHIVKETSPRPLKWIYNKICQFCVYMVTPSAMKKTEEKKVEEKKTN